jgi:hypothetical protein
LEYVSFEKSLKFIFGRNKTSEPDSLSVDYRWIHMESFYCDIPFNEI